MYMTFRQMTVDPTRMQDALGLVGWVVHRLNEEHGGNFGYSIPIGGDPTMIAVASGWETLGQYEAMRAATMEDEEIQSAMRMGATLTTSSQDMIARVLAPPGDRGAFASITTARAHTPALHAAVEFALEVSEFAEGKTGRKVGLMISHTGDRSQIAWLAYGSSLDDLAANDDELEADAEFQSFYKRSEDLMISGSLERSLWQLLG